MSSAATPDQDVMQICLNGHVITALFRSNPESARSHCDRCGATTIESCPTCGCELPGARPVPVTPIGALPRPNYCSNCGAAFSWTERPHDSAPEPIARLEALLRSLPEVIRELRFRHSDRPPFQVSEARDLEDLVRALLPIEFKNVRYESRTPAYAAVTRTDFLLADQGVALTVKHGGVGAGERQLAAQLEEDVAYYRRDAGCRTFVCLVYDPESRLRQFALPDSLRCGPEPSLETRLFVVAP